MPIVFLQNLEPVDVTFGCIALTHLLGDLKQNK